MLELWPYQERAVDLIREKKSVFLMADVGLGKTAIALNAIEETGGPALVIAPLRVIYSTWPEEIKKWTPKLTYTILHGKMKNTRLNLNRDIYLLNYDGLKWFYNACVEGKFRMRKYFMVWDESSFVKSPSTKRFKTLKKMFPIFSKYRLALSATPAPNGYQELWSQYYMLDRGKRLRASFYSYRDAYFHYTGAPMYKIWPRESAHERIEERVKDITFRLSGADYLKLPEIIYNRMPVNLPAAARKKYDTLEKDFLLKLDKGVVDVFNAAAMSMKLRQFVQGFVYVSDGVGEEVHTEKIDALKATIEGSAGNPILCAIQFKHELKMIRREIDPNVPVIAGGTSAHLSAQYIRDWNAGNLPLLLCHPASLGHGVNLQAGGHIIVWMAMTWSLEQYIQLNGRLARQGQKKAVVVNHLVVKDSIDDVVLATVKTKNRTQQGLLDALNAYRKEKNYA